MNFENYFKDIFKSIPDYRKIVLLIFLIEIDGKLLKEIGFSKNDIDQLSLECKNILIEEHENYLDYLKHGNGYCFIGIEITIKHIKIIS